MGIIRTFKQANRLRLLMGLDAFVLLLMASIGLAYLWPQPGVAEGPFTLHTVADYGVAFIFFFYGMKLSPAQLRQGLSNMRLHGVVQVSTFILFPLLALVLMHLMGTWGNHLFWIGTFYLAALPSTVSSSVVMVSIARGNVPAAIFNASLSSLMGVFITPIWMSIVMATESGSYDLGNIFFKLSMQVLLPVVAGVVLLRKFGGWVMRHQHGLRWFDQIIILLIVYTSFCESFAHKMFEGHSGWSIFLLSIAMVGLFFIMFGIISLIDRLLHFTMEDHITSVFCGSKKSLVHGTVMSKVLFPGMAGVGIILLPLMLYHTLQLVAASIIAVRWGKRKINGDN